jgi:hypothetical protein
LLTGLIQAVHAGVLDCESGPFGTGNPSGCTDADRKHYEELKKQVDTEMAAQMATLHYCEANREAPPDKCPADVRKIIDDSEAASRAKLQREYEIWQQGAEARKQEVKAKQDALLKQELADIDKQYRAAAQQGYEDHMRQEGDRLQQQQMDRQRDLDDFNRKVSQSESDLFAQRAQQQAAETQARQAQQRVQPPTVHTPARPDPLAPAPDPAQTAESRRAAGLPDDPNAAKCVEDPDCARAVLGRGH